MPGDSRKINLPDGREIEATPLAYRPSGEHWNEYLVDDGTVVRLKLVVTEVLRLEGEYDQMGNPAYLVQSTNVVNIQSPENLRKG